jgi:predicted metal-binding membrane protein
VRQVRSSIITAAIVTIAAWAYTISAATTMLASMPMPGGWSMSMAWMSMGHQSTLAHASMFLVMWTVMMIAMMLPSVMPAVLLHRRLVRSRVERGDRAAASQILLLAGYFSIWVAFGAVAYALGMTVAAAAMRSVRVSQLVPVATGAALAAAGVYQLTQWKQLCAVADRRWTSSRGARFAAPPTRGDLACTTARTAPPAVGG